jgi:transposase
MTPPAKQISPMTSSQLSQCLEPESTGPAVDTPNAQRKRQKQLSGAKLSPVCEDNSDVEPKRKAPIGTRQVPVKGKLRSYKIRLYPTAPQAAVIKCWYSASNRYYNQAVDVLRKYRYPAMWNKLRDTLVPNDKITREKDQWLLNVPTRVRGRAVKQAVDAHKINLQEKGAGHFGMRYRSYNKDPMGCIILEKCSGTTNGPLHSFHPCTRFACSSQKSYGYAKMCDQFKNTGTDPYILMRDRHQLIDQLVKDGRPLEDAKILWDKRINQFWLIVLIDKPVKAAVPGLEPRVVSLDPGVRSFNTYYSPDGTHGELLKGALPIMRRMNRKVDKIKGQVDRERVARKESQTKGEWVTSHETSHRRCRHMKRRMAKVNHRLRCWRNNAHYDAVNFLLTNNDWVMIPEFQTSKMVKKKKRVMNKQSVRDTYVWSHYKFRQILVKKAELDANKRIELIGEPGTSKTCGNCGGWDKNLGGKKEYSCGICGVKLDRDINGARNNLLALFH